MELRVLTTQGTYVGGVGLLTLVSVVQALCPGCSECSKKMTFFCMEECCSEERLFCKDCRGDHHFLHKTNDIKVLLIDQRYYTTEKQLLDQFDTLIAKLVEQKTNAQVIMENSCRLFEILEKNLVRLEALRSKFVNDCWHDALYSAVEAYMNKEKPVSHTTRVFERQFSRMKLDAPKRIILDGLSEVETIKRFLETSISGIDAGEIKIQTSLINSDQEVTVASIVKQLSLDSYVDTTPGKSIMILLDQYRSARINRNHIEGHLAFDGSRLIIEKSKNNAPIESYSLPFLKELHTEVEFTTFPNVKELGIFIRSPPNLQLLNRIPSTVEALRVYFEFIQPPLTLTFAEIDQLVDILMKMPHVKQLSLSVQSMDRHNYLKLIKYAINNNLRGLQVCVSKEKAVWNYNFGKSIMRPKYLDQVIVTDLSRVVQTKLAQVSVIEKTRCIRLASRIFKEQILRTCCDQSSEEMLRDDSS